MEYKQIRYEVEDGILTITLDRPEKLNAFTPTMFRELLDAFDRADEDDEVRVVLVTGAGRAFCAGADLSAGEVVFDRSRGRAPTTLEEHRDEGGIVVLRIFDMKKPVLAAIHGPAVGVGVTMTLPMDVRIASTEARFGFVFTRRGIVPEACSSWFLPRLVGMDRAAEWVFTGRVFGAEEALEAGLVSRIVSPEELLPTARKLGREIAENTSAVAVALSRQLLWKMLGASHPVEAHRIDSKCMYWLGRSPDAQEGVRAFLEKRPPRFVLRPSRDMPEFYPWWEAAREGREKT
ncbi:MAG: enoyl-CoA hydratase [Candidatus Binatia bacterium]|nr:MAG: enoyl-CoA hydratase [Candidatus Binatia bacterium]